MTRYTEINLLEANLKDFLFEFMDFSRLITKNDKKNELIERILRLRNFAKKLVDLLDEMYVEELKGGNNGKGKD